MPEMKVACGPSRPVSALCLVVVSTAVLGLACRSTPQTPTPTVTADTWAVVDSQAIMRQDVEKAYNRARDVTQPLSDEEALAVKLGVLDDLITQQLLLAKAPALKLSVAETEVDAAVSEARKNIADDAFQQELNRRSLTLTDIRDGLRRELLAKKVLDQEAQVAVTDQEVSAFFNANRAQFNLPEEAYHIAQLVVTPVREAQITNASGDDATTPEAAAAKVRMLMERLKGGASFRDLAVGYSEDPESAPRGGDLGLLPVSTLKQAPPPLRDAVLNKEPGSINVAASGGAYTMVLVIAREPAGQRDLSMPAVKDGITQTLKGRKEQLFRTAYLTNLRGDASIVNYLAKRVVESKGQLPSMPLTAPPKP